MINFLQKSQWTHVSIPLPRGELGRSKDDYFRNIKLYKNGKVVRVLLEDDCRLRVRQLELLMRDEIMNGVSRSTI